MFGEKDKKWVKKRVVKEAKEAKQAKGEEEKEEEEEDEEGGGGSLVCNFHTAQFLRGRSQSFRASRELL